VQDGIDDQAAANQRRSVASPMSRAYVVATIFTGLASLIVDPLYPNRATRRAERDKFPATEVSCRRRWGLAYMRSSPDRDRSARGGARAKLLGL